MNLSRPDRRERLDQLAAEFALGTSPPRVRRRLTAIARRDRVVATALSEWERRIAALAAGVPAVTPPARVWQQIVTRLGLDPDGAPAASVKWWRSLGFWRAFATASFVVAVGLGVSEWQRTAEAPAAPLVVVLAGSDAKAALIATATRGQRYLTLKTIGNAAPASGKVFELWALPQAGAPQALGVIPAGGLVRVNLANPVEESLSNIPALAVSLEPPGGSPTGQPTGPVLYSGAIERMY
ncbi:MAG: anti-sigma factor [Casimicrobiaceae bacterium]|nr:anti-sigma factor [Pseudomonadota bacterium]